MHGNLENYIQHGIPTEQIIEKDLVRNMTLGVLPLSRETGILVRYVEQSVQVGENLMLTILNRLHYIQN